MLQRTISGSTNQTVINPHHIIGADSPLLADTNELRPLDPVQPSPLSHAASESPQDSTVSLIDVSPSASQFLEATQAGTGSSSSRANTVDAPAALEQASAASSESSDFEFISPPVSSWGAEDEEGAGALSPRLSDVDALGWSRPHSPFSAHAHNTSEAGSLIWDAEEGEDRAAQDSLEIATSGLTIREGSNQHAVLRPTSPGQKSDDSWAHLSDDAHL